MKKEETGKERVARWYSECLVSARQGDLVNEAFCQAIYDLNIELDLKLDLEEW